MWKASIKPSGYGQFHLDGTTVLAHRFAYEDAVGPIPEGLHLDHLCGVRRCVNPAHLEPVTIAENNRRADAAKWQRNKTHCANGHPYTDDNTYWRPDRPNSRDCRQCHWEAHRRYVERKKDRRG